MNKNNTTLKSHQDLIKVLNRCADKYDRNQLFSDFLWFLACRISNCIDPVHFQNRQEIAAQLDSKHDEKVNAAFKEMFSILSEIILQKTNAGYVTDVLGSVFEGIGGTSAKTGQFFTPMDLCRLMTKIVTDDTDTKEPISICEPCCGSGRIILAFAEEMQKKGRNYCTDLVVLATDVDIRCVLMTYIQLSLYGIPAVVLHGDTLMCKEYDRWYTPMYVLGDWVWCMPLGITPGRNQDDELLKIMSRPEYAAFRSMDSLLHSASSKSTYKDT